MPYYWALAPDYDLTLLAARDDQAGPADAGRMAPAAGQRLLHRSAPAGIYQLDKDYFLRSDGPATPGYRDFRGSIETSGQFALTDKWIWGWDGIAADGPDLSSRTTGLPTYQRNTNSAATRR